MTGHDQNFSRLLDLNLRRLIPKNVQKPIRTKWNIPVKGDQQELQDHGPKNDECWLGAANCQTHDDNYLMILLLTITKIEFKTILAQILYPY